MKKAFSVIMMCFIALPVFVVSTLSASSPAELINSSKVLRSFEKVSLSSSGVDWWPMFHHDVNHTGYSTLVGPVTNHVLWNYYTGGAVLSSPAVVGGVVYVGSEDSNVYALNATTGMQLWNYTTSNWVDSSPAVAGDVVYVGSRDNNVYALNATTGTQIWNYTTGGAVGSPAVVLGVVCVSSGYKMYALNATTGTQIWSYTTGGPVSSSPAVVDGVAYVGSGPPDYNVYALNAITGTVVWSYLTGGPVGSSPAVVDGVVYVGSGDHKVYALNATTGALVWSYTTSAGVVSSPAVAGGVVYVGSELDFSTLSAYVWALNATTGVLVWKYKTGDGVSSSPAVAGGVAYVGSWDGNVYALNATNGAVVWNYLTISAVSSSPAVGLGAIYVGSFNGKVYAFGESVHEVAVDDLVSSKTVVGQGFSTNVSITVTDPGSYPETFNTTAYLNAIHIASQNSTLSSGGSATIVFTWNTTGFAYGSYNLTAYAWPVPDEMNAANNNMTVWVTVTIAGDLNGDFKVSLQDLVLLANAYGSKPGDAKWNPNADINGDDKVSLSDLVLMANHYGQHYP